MLVTAKSDLVMCRFAFLAWLVVFEWVRVIGCGRRCGDTLENDYVVADLTAARTGHDQFWLFCQSTRLSNWAKSLPGFVKGRIPNAAFPSILLTAGPSRNQCRPSRLAYA